MPPDARWQQIDLPGLWFGEEWESYNVHLFGMRAIAEEWPPRWPCWALAKTGATRPGIVAQLWLRQVRCTNSPAYIEARWHPESGDSISLQGLASVARHAEAQRVLTGLKLLRMVDRRGRQEGSRSVSKGEFRERMPAHYFEYLDSQGEPPSEQWLADTFGVTLRTLSRYLAAHKRDGFPYPPRR